MLISERKAHEFSDFCTYVYVDCITLIMKLKSLALFILFVISAVPGYCQFSLPLTINTGSNASYNFCLPADVDNDGIDELIMGLSDQFDIFKKTDGEYHLVYSRQYDFYSEFSNYLVIQLTSDINSDGFQDIVFGINTTDTTFAGNPDSYSGRFIPPGPPPPPGCGLVWVYLNDGNAEFTHSKLIHSNLGDIADIKCADLLGDGEKEIVVSSSSSININDSTGVISYYNIDNVPNKVSVFYNHSFEDSLYSEELIINDSPAYFSTIGFRDANSDGVDDVYYLDATDNRLKWIMNESNGAFGVSEYVPEQDSLIDDFQFHELNGDGIPDLVFIQRVYPNSSYRKIGYRLSVSPSEFGDYHLLIDSVYYASFRNFSFADVENDGDTDIIYKKGSFADIVYYSNSGNGEFGISENKASGWLSSTPIYPIKADLNDDVDLFFPSYQGQLLISTDAFSEESTSGFIEPTTFPSLDWSLAYDVNQDGLNDILSYSSMINSILWFENLNNASFSDYKVLQRGGGGTIYRNAIDVDNDGKKEIILLNSSSYSSSNLNVFSPEYANTDSALVLNTNFNYLYYDPFFFGEIDNDSLPDFVFIKSFESSRYLSVRRNLGGGQFDTVLVTPAEFRYVGAMVSIDWDEDGLNDIVYQQWDSLMWVRNMGEFQFDTAQSMNVHDVYALYNELKDWNNDGKPDLFISLKEGPTGAPYEYKLYCMQNGNGTSKYLEELTETMQETFKEIKFAEFNQNGPPEVIGRSYSANSGYTGSIKYSEMSGDYYLDLISLPFTGASTEYEVADMNGDGKADVFTRSSTYLRIYYNVFNSNITSENGGQMKECEIYPNPTNGRIYLTKQCGGDSPMHISIRGVDGRLIYEENTKTDFVDIPASTQRGLYFLIVKTKAGTNNFRLILN